MRLRYQTTNVGQVSKIGRLEILQQKCEVCNLFRPKTYAIDLSQWTKKSKISKPGVLQPLSVVHNYTIDLSQ